MVCWLTSWFTCSIFFTWIRSPPPTSLTSGPAPPTLHPWSELSSPMLTWAGSGLLLSPLLLLSWYVSRIPFTLLVLCWLWYYVMLLQFLTKIRARFILSSLISTAHIVLIHILFLSERLLFAGYYRS